MQILKKPYLLSTCNQQHRFWLRNKNNFWLCPPIWRPEQQKIVDLLLIACWFCVCFLFSYAILCVPSSFAIILTRKRELVTLLSLSSWCLVTVIVLCSSSWCRGLVCSVWLWCFLFILTYLFGYRFVLLVCLIWSFKFVCLFDLILYVPSTISQLNRDGSSWVEPVLS